MVEDESTDDNIRAILAIVQQQRDEISELSRRVTQLAQGSVIETDRNLMCVSEGSDVDTDQTEPDSSE